MPEDTVNVRYMVHDVDAAVDFYTKHFGFTVGTRAAPAFADVFLGHLRLLISGPTSSGARPMPDGKKPEPGGWNRIEFVVDDIQAEVERLRAEGVDSFRNDIVTGLEASRSCSTIPPATPSRSSSPPASSRAECAPVDEGRGDDAPHVPLGHGEHEEERWREPP